MGRIESKFYDAVMMRGSTKWSYWLAKYVMDTIVLLIPMPFFELSFFLFGIQFPGFSAIYAMFAFTEPLFQYVFIYAFGIAWDSGASFVFVVSILGIILGNTMSGIASGLALSSKPGF